MVNTLWEYGSHLPAVGQFSCHFTPTWTAWLQQGWELSLPICTTTRHVLSSGVNAASYQMTACTFHPLIAKARWKDRKGLLVWALWLLSSLSFQLLLGKKNRAEEDISNHYNQSLYLDGYPSTVFLLLFSTEKWLIVGYPSVRMCLMFFSWLDWVLSFGKKTTEAKSPSYHIMSDAQAINIIYFVEVHFNHLAQGVYRVSPLWCYFPHPFHTVLSERKSRCTTHS